MTQEQSTFFDNIYAEQFENLVSYAYRFLWDWDDARVAVQEAFLTGILKIDEFYSSESPIGWLKKTIQFTTSNMNRARKIRRERLVPLDEAKIQNATYDRYEGINTITARCAEILSPEEYAIFEATILAGEPASKVYERFGLSYDAFRKRLSRILTKLQKNWNT